MIIFTSLWSHFTKTRWLYNGSNNILWLATTTTKTNKHTPTHIIQIPLTTLTMTGASIL